jgi:hypothetical protein
VVFDGMVVIDRVTAPEAATVELSGFPLMGDIEQDRVLRRDQSLSRVP